jgi:hypothetical protein
MTLTIDNAGVVREWCEQRGAKAVIRGGPGGGSKGGSVLVTTATSRFELRPGDSVRMIKGVGLAPDYPEMD